MNEPRYHRGDRYQGRTRIKKGRAPHALHAITVSDVEPIGEEHDRVEVTCQCGASWSFVHWWRRSA